LFEETPIITDSNDDAFGDEYPVVWLDPNMYSEEKRALKDLVEGNRAISLFSEFEEALKFAESLGVSFLLIVPDDLDEKFLIEGFCKLEDTCGRGAYEVEEESVLKGLFPGISQETRSGLEVYVYFTRKDFANEAPISEDEEEVMVMADVKEMVKEFREESTIIWYDVEVNPEKKLLMEEFEIEEKNIYTDYEDLIKRIDGSADLPYHFIVSGEKNGDQVIEKIKDHKDLLCLYIYNIPPKVSGLKNRKIKTGAKIEEIIPKIKEGVREKSNLKYTFPAFATNFDDWDKSYINKVHYYLRGFVNFTNRKQAKRDFLNLALNIYQSKKMLQFERAYSTYDKEQILRWYAEESPVYKLINNCLRISTDDSILYCRFILKDMERAIQEEYNQETEKFSGVVYRAAYISNEEFEKLERNVGKEIEMYGFLSTSINQESAVNFLNEDIGKKVFITIIVPPFPDPELDEQGFINISKYSPFEEKEILFNVRSRFQVLKVGTIPVLKTECRHLVLFYGTHLLRKHITLKKPFTSLEFHMSPLCNYCKSKNNLFSFGIEENQTVCKECLRKGSASSAIFFWPINEKDEEMKKIDCPGEILKFPKGASFADSDYKCDVCLRKGEKEYFKWKNINDERIIIECAECFEKDQESKEGYFLILEANPYMFWSKGQNVWEKADMEFTTEENERFQEWEGADVFFQVQSFAKGKEVCQRILKNLAMRRRRERMKLNYYAKCGKASWNLKENKSAIEYLLQLLNMLKFIYGEKHPFVSNTLNNFAIMYDSFGMYEEALKYHLDALEITKFVYAEIHPKTANSFNNIAEVYRNLGQHQKSIENQIKALDIYRSIYGELHPMTATSFNNLALVFSDLGQYQKALEYHTKALNIIKSIFGEIHPDTANSLNNLAGVCRSLGRHQEALDYFMKAFEVRKSIYGEKHPSTAISFNNIASVYSNLGRHKEALKYYVKALDLTHSIYGKEHPSTATALNNFAESCNNLGIYKEALKYHLNALNIRKSIFGETHPDTANSLNNLAEVYHNLGQYQEAIEYHTKALSIYQSIYGETHPDTATSFSNLATVYYSLEQYQNAFENHMKALDIRKTIYGEAHPSTATSLNNLAIAYLSLGQHQEALENFMKALEIRKSIYGETHSSIANSLHNIGELYSSLEKYQEALDYFMKALDMRKSIHGEMHPSTATSFNSLGEVYNKLGQNKEALDSLTKALGIRAHIFGEKHPVIAASFSSLALVHNSIGESQKALQFHLHALNLITSFYGEYHSKTVFLKCQISELYFGAENQLEELSTYLKNFYEAKKPTSKEDPESDDQRSGKNS